MTKPKVYKSVLIISDYHSPFQHPDSVAFLTALKKKYKPDFVISSGDEADFHALSFHDSDPDLDSVGVELDKAIAGLQPLYKLFPDMVIMESNHGSMVLRKGLSSGISKRMLRSYNEVLEAPKGWRWVPDFIFHTPLGPVYVCHGKTTSPGKLSSQYGMSTIQGHFHEKSQINYTSTPHRLIFDMHVGCLVDDSSRAMAYNKLNMKRPIISCAVVENGIPHIIPMVLNQKGRWIGSL
jgi:hypothetical protein